MTLTTAASDQPTTVVLVGVDFGRSHFDGDLQELGLLAQTAGLAPVARITALPILRSLGQGSRSEKRLTLLDFDAAKGGRAAQNDGVRHVEGVWWQVGTYMQLLHL